MTDRASGVLGLTVGEPGALVEQPTASSATRKRGIQFHQASPRPPNESGSLRPAQGRSTPGREARLRELILLAAELGGYARYSNPTSRLARLMSGPPAH